MGRDSDTHLCKDYFNTWLKECTIHDIGIFTTYTCVTSYTRVTFKRGELQHVQKRVGRKAYAIHK